MTRSLVLTVIGPDRPGIVDLLSRTVNEAGGNWLESQMSRLAGQFAGILRVECEDEKVEALRASIDALPGLRVIVDEGTEEETPQGVHLEVVGGDRPGIVRQIAGKLAGYGVNVLRLETSRTGAPWSGGALFRANALIAVPPEVSLDQLRQELEAIALDLMVEVKIAD
ncbi:MAG: ACT domain-containing protein [Sandaracinus sp.]|nr:ACT domain-containing protein [Sandaracinus sp.]MCB9612986.1 ACT domain-containing protein [Sandaracinus sp.]MCB9619130.1 ACT domain-containing protein [Sandaracinus sp.]MCB9632713.1 ACT domain-containing protein [Sandaracinus sp.]